MPSDDISLLKQLRERGEITEEQYDALRRHVLWGTPLPEDLADEPEPELEPEPEPEPAPEPEHVPEVEQPTATLPVRPAPPRRPSQARHFEPAPAAVPTPRHRAKESPPVPAPRTPRPPPVTHAARPSPVTERARRGGFVLPLLAAILVLAIAGAAVWYFALRSPSRPAATAYAHDVCAQVGPWRHDVQNAAQGLASDLSGAGRTDAKTTATRYYDEQADRTEHLRGALRDLGTPSIGGGADYAHRLDAAVTTAAGRFRNLEQQVRELEPTGRSSFDTALTVLTQHPQAPADVVTPLLGGDGTPAPLADAFADTSACSSVRP